MARKAPQDKPPPGEQKVPAESASAESPAGGRLVKYREKILELLAIGLPTALITAIFKLLADRFLSQPWQAVWFVVPLAAVAWIAWQAARGRRELRLRGPALVFFVAYLSCFSLAASSSLLDWNRKATVFGQPVPRSWLAPNRTGDWRYWLFPREPGLSGGRPVPADVILVVRGRPQGAARDVREARLLLSGLIRLAADSGARGVALDFLFLQSSEMDPVLCATIQSAGIPVLLAFPFEASDGDFVRVPATAALERCVPAAAWGHAVGFVDLDRKVRFVPLYFRHQEDLPALSLRAAETLAGGKVEVPASGLLQFVAPPREIPRVTFEALQRDRTARARLRDRFLFVGEESARDRYATPYGDRSGVWIHAAALQALRYHQYVERSPWWASLGILAVACYLLMARAARGDSARQLAIFCAAASLAVVAIAALACRALLWVDVIYPLAAVWLLLTLVLARRTQRKA